MISAFRRATHSFLSEQDLLPVHEFIPDDLTALPCVVIGGITLADGAEQGTFDLSMPLFVCGRRVGDDDSQNELAEFVDHVVVILGGTKGRHAHDHHFAVTRADPQVVTVAGQDVPAYSLTVETTVLNC